MNMSMTITGVLAVVLATVLDATTANALAADIMTIVGIFLTWYGRFRHGDITWYGKKS